MIRAAAAVLAVVAGVHLVAQIAGYQPLIDLSHVLLVPATGWLLWTGTAAPRGVLVWLMFAGLGLSWLGDAVPRVLTGETAFLAMLSFFFVAQLVYAVAFAPYRARSALTRPAWMLPYVGGAVVIILLCASATGPLLPALIGYAAAIMAMAVLATGLGHRAALGGGLFVVADALIALDVFDVLALPGHGFVAMACYIGAQTLLVLGVRDQWSRNRAAAIGMPASQNEEFSSREAGRG